MVVGLYLAFGPTYTECSSSLQLNGSAGHETCRAVSLLQAQGFGFPFPFAFIFLWSLAPFLMVAAAWWLAPRTRVPVGGVDQCNSGDVLEPVQPNWL